MSQICYTGNFQRFVLLLSDSYVEERLEQLDSVTKPFHDAPVAACFRLARRHHNTL